MLKKDVIYRHVRLLCLHLIFLLGHLIAIPKKILKVKKEYQLRVLTYHNVGYSEVEKFERQLDYLSKKWKFIDYETFQDILENRKELTCDCLLITFDDGFKSCMNVLGILDRHSIKAIYFIVLDYMLQDSQKWKNFLITRIQPNANINKIDIGCENLNITDIQHIISRGHLIGAHTKTHIDLGSVDDNVTLVNEIVDSANQLEKIFSIKINHFAITFGRAANFSGAALMVARERFAYVYSGLRGNNKNFQHYHLVTRDSIEPKDSLVAISAICSGLLDYFYKKELINMSMWSK